MGEYVRAPERLLGESLMVQIGTPRAVMRCTPAGPGRGCAPGRCVGARGW